MTLASSAPRLQNTRAAGPEVTVALDGITKSFPVQRGWWDLLRHPLRRERVTVLSGVSLQVRAGEFFGLLGPNGAGKTTLFKMLATLVLPDGGTGRVAGHDIVLEPSAVRRVLTPVIADERSLHWRLSARENLLLFAALHRVPAREVRARVASLLETVGLEATAEQMVGKFSSGMKQRLLIARALLARPRVLLLDEPTRSLDPVSAREFRSFLRREVAEAQGCTVLLATHNAEEALDLCDRVAILHRGRLLAVGPPADLATELERGRYRLWTTLPEHPTFGALAERGVIHDVCTDGPAADGWTAVTMEITGGPQQAAAVLAFLVENGVTVARFEPTRLSLADLIDRVVQRGNAADA